MAATYDRILRGIEDAGDETITIAKKVLPWVIGAVRPLRLREISDAIMVSPRHFKYDRDVELVDPTVILEICSSLLHYESRTGYVTIAHFSVQEYLLSDYLGHTSLRKYYLSSMISVHTYLAICLISYLCFDSFSVLCNTEPEARSLCKDSPLLSYAGEHWATHVLAVDTEDEDLFSVLKGFALDKRYKVNHFVGFQAYQLMVHWNFFILQPDADRPNAATLSGGCDPIFPLVQLRGQTWSLRQLLTLEPELRDHVTADMTVLMTACRSRNFGTVKTLLEAGADVNLVYHGALYRHENQEPVSALPTALWNFDKDIAMLLIAFGANINVDTGGSWTCIHAAIYGGFLDAVQLAVEQHCELNVLTSSGKTALRVAIEAHSRPISSYLIEHGAFIEQSVINLKEEDLYWAHTEPWYNQMISAIKSHHDMTLTAQDMSVNSVQSVMLMLTHRLHLPAAISRRILDLGDCWAIRSIFRDDAISVTSSDSLHDIPYLSLVMPQGLQEHPLRKVTFIMRSCDQGM